MLILGLHFGHDAAAALVRDGEILGCVEKERHTRRKHAAVLRAAQVRRLLEDCGVRAEDVDACTVTSTQGVELVFLDPDEVSVAYGPHQGETFGSFGWDGTAETHQEWLAGGRSDYRRALDDPGHHVRRFLDPEELERFTDAPSVASVERFVWADEWDGLTTLDALGRADLGGLIGVDATRNGFHWPATVSLFGRSVPAAVFSHHHAHAAYAYFESGYPSAAVLSHDGGVAEGIESGLLSFGEGHRLWSVAPHRLAAGELYDVVAARLGLGTIGGAGKLMGLSSYGRPRFFDPAFVGTPWDAAPGDTHHAHAWIEHCTGLAARLGYDLAPLGDPGAITAPVNVDIAASTQRLFEETVTATVRAFGRVLDRAGRRTRDLCVTGGTALNCPANTRLRNESRFDRVAVAPGCGDSGLAIGSALALWHGPLDQPLRPDRTTAVYLGLRASAAAAEAVLDRRSDAVLVEDLGDAAPEAAAADLAADRLVGWFEGRSELGPRALGHRSLLADPTHAENWGRVNKVKGREWWRPFAPMVLEEQADAWFAEAPVPSPHMLFNARVRTERIPAVTHVDGSARTQTVSAGDGAIHRVLTAFFDRTGVPVLMNTSFNGPAEPIVETVDHAVDFLLATDLDAVYVEGRWRVTRR